MLGETKLSTIQVLNSKALINSSISYDEFVSVDNVLKEHDNMKKEIKYPNNIK